MNDKHFFFGFGRWKYKFVKLYFPDIEDDKIVFINDIYTKSYFAEAIKCGLSKDSVIHIWGRKIYIDIENFAKENSLKIYRIEDGFIRSVGLGSDLTQPYSLVIDSHGIYFDPTVPSDLEIILNTTTFDEDILKRAKKLKEYLLEKKLSKYNFYENKKLDVPTDKNIVLVPGQVEDDASIKYGASGMTNLELLKQARKNAKDAYIIYKPHPDVLVGNRVGNIDEDIALTYADKVVTEVGLDSVLEICNEVHTMTSLVGFEALMRNKKVFTYGMPFYAGWGLTNDTIKCDRRNKIISIDALVAATLIMYPLYIHPKTQVFCKPEEVLAELDEQKKHHDSSLIHRCRLNVKNFISRKSRAIWRKVKSIFKVSAKKKENNV